jgi:hypothetical protein
LRCGCSKGVAPRTDDRLYKPVPLSRLLHEFADAVIGVSSGFWTRLRKRRQVTILPVSANFSRLFRSYRATKVTNLRVQTSRSSRRRGLHFGSPPGRIATKGLRSGSPGLQASELRRVEAARASLKLAADNNLERYGTPRFHVEHFRGTHGTFCGTTRTCPEVNPVALNPGADGSVLPFKRTGPLRRPGFAMRE